MIKKFKKIFLSKDFLLFLIIGGINTVNGISFALFYSKIFEIVFDKTLSGNLGFIVGYINALFFAYLLNIVFIFFSKFNIKKLIKFSISYIPNFIIQNICVFVIFNIMGLPNMLAYTIAAIIGIPITFILVKFFTFKK